MHFKPLISVLVICTKLTCLVIGALICISGSFFICAAINLHVWVFSPLVLAQAAPASISSAGHHSYLVIMVSISVEVKLIYHPAKFAG